MVSQTVREYLDYADLPAIGVLAGVAAILGIAVAVKLFGSGTPLEPLMLQCTEPQVIQFTFHAKRIERDDNTYIITGKDGVVVRFEKSAYAYCLVVPEKEGG